MPYSIDDKGHTLFYRHLKYVGEKYLLLILAVQVFLVPTHIFTTDFVDETLKFTTLSIGLRLGTSVFFVVCYLLFKKNLQLYFSITFFANAVSDGYLAAIFSRGLFTNSFGRIGHCVHLLCNLNRLETYFFYIIAIFITNYNPHFLLSVWQSFVANHYESRRNISDFHSGNLPTY